MSLRCVFIIWLLSVGCIFPYKALGQETRADTTSISGVRNVSVEKQDSVSSFIWQPTKSLFLELLGKGFYSLNMDFRKKSSHSFSIGIQFLEGGYFPSLMYYHFFGEKFNIEAGGGVSAIISGGGDAKAMEVHGVIGYRSQKKKGAIFRGGFTPYFGIPFTKEGKHVFVPLVGISLGYSF